MQKIEVIVRITKDHCPPQEQTIFEWIETNRTAPDTLNYPGLEINLEHRRVFKNGQEVYMSRYEYGVLSLMARHPGQLFTKEQIFEAVWHQDSESCLTAVTNTIGRIRANTAGSGWLAGCARCIPRPSPGWHRTTLATWRTAT